MDARTCAAVWVQRKGGNGWEEGPVGMSERGCADGVRTESIQESEMDGEKGPMDMTEHGCADVRRRCGRKGMNGNGEGEREKGPVGMGERGCADVRGRRGLPGSPYNPFKKIDYANFSWCIRSVA